MIGEHLDLGELKSLFLNSEQLILSLYNQLLERVARIEQSIEQSAFTDLFGNWSDEERIVALRSPKLRRLVAELLSVPHEERRGAYAELRDASAKLIASTST